MEALRVSIPQAYSVFDAWGTVTDPDIDTRWLELGRQVARFAQLHKCEEALTFLREWEAAPENPGGSAPLPGDAEKA